MARSPTTNSGINLDCSSNATLVTNVSPFNSQTALIAEKKVLSAGNPPAVTTNHYYEQNLRNNHQKALNGSHIYDPLDKDHDHDYKQLDPLLNSESPYAGIVGNKRKMSSQDIKMKESAMGSGKLHGSLQGPKESKPSVMRYTSQVINILFLFGYVKNEKCDFPLCWHSKRAANK